MKRSRDRWFGRILGLLRSSQLDDAVWEELEEILISADVGVDTSLRIIEELQVLPDKVQKALDTDEQVRPVAQKYADRAESTGAIIDPHRVPLL